MTWGDIGKSVLQTVPVLGGALLGPAGQMVGNLIATIFGVDSNPDSVSQAIANDPQSSIKLLEIQSQNQIALQQLVVQSESNQFQAIQSNMSEVNQTMRAELSTSDKYKTYWRPTVGYQIGTGFFILLLSLAFSLVYIVTKEPQLSSTILPSIGDFYSKISTDILGALSILGIGIYTRSKDKAAELGYKSSSIMDIVKTFKGK